MKRISIIATAALALIFTSCQEDASSLTGLDQNDLNSTTSAIADTETISNISAETLQESSYESVDLITDEGIEHFFKAADKFRKGKLDCAVVTRDSLTNTITIDFGDGCENPNGTLRSGKIIIQHSESRHVAGSYRIVTFENFVLDSIMIEGTRTMTNTTDATIENGPEIFEITLVGGKLTLPDGSTITRDSEHIRSLYAGDTVTASYTTLTGSASGVLQDGTEYTSTILEEIVITRECNLHVPVSGVKEFLAGENSLTIDFGNGECDNLADVTTNGVTETIELETRENLGKGKGGKGQGRKGPKGGKVKGGKGGK